MSPGFCQNHESTQRGKWQLRGSVGVLQRKCRREGVAWLRSMLGAAVREVRVSNRTEGPFTMGFSWDSLQWNQDNAPGFSGKTT